MRRGTLSRTTHARPLTRCLSSGQQSLLCADHFHTARAEHHKLVVVDPYLVHRPNTCGAMYAAVIVDPFALSAHRSGDTGFADADSENDRYTVAVFDALSLGERWASRRRNTRREIDTAARRDGHGAQEHSWCRGCVHARSPE